jgi:hypothetical protein
MKNKNSVYTVTPPDLKLNTIGPIVLFMGITLDELQPYADIYDKLFPEVEITFYVSEKGFRPELAPWFRAVASMSSGIFVNLDNITTEEVFLAIQAILDRKNDVMVYWISQNKKSNAMMSLLNSYQYRIFTRLEDISKFLINEYDK